MKRTQEVPELEPIDVGEWLGVIEQVRNMIPERDRSPVPLRPPTEGRLSFTPGSATEFDYQILMEALETMLAELDFARARNIDRGLDAYYEAVESMKDPEQAAQLAPDVEKFRRAYESVYKRPIPPNPKKK
jgi:hypothetical protein